jgi:adenylate cyclase
MTFASLCGKFSWRAALLGLLCGLAAWLLVRILVIHGLEEWMFDGCFYFRGDRTTKAKVVIVALDESSLDAINEPLVYLSPKLAKVVRYLHERGASAIGLDVIIPEQFALLAEVAEGGVGDATTLGKARDETGIVVLPELKIKGGARRPLPQWRGKAIAHPRPDDLGFVNLTTDPDHFLRRQQLYIREGDRAEMHFALALFARAGRREVEWDGDTLRVGGETVPLDDQQAMRINFVGPAETIPSVPFRDVLESAESERPLRVDLDGAIVIVGVTASSQQDVYPTPYANNYWRARFTSTSGLMSGSEVHANIIATLNDRAFVRSQDWLSSLPALLTAGVLLGLVFGQLNHIRGTGRFLLAGFALFLAHHFGWRWLCVEAFRLADWRVEMLGMLYLGLFVWLGSFGVRWLEARRILRVVTGPFGSVMEAEPSRLGRGEGEERVVTVLFADVRSFSQFSQEQPPRKVMALLNRYFAAVIPVLEGHGGTVNQFLGDGLMVLFGAPEPNERHAAAAVRAAAAMVRRVHELKEVWAEMSCPGFRIGVGIHTGPVIVGTLGYARRLTYTAIGDTVNAAARIEPENKTFKTEILISATTHGYLPSDERGRLGCDETPVAVELRGVGTLNLYPVRAGG